MDTVEKGVFYGSIGVYRFDEVGRPISMDHITRAFKIELVGLPMWNVHAHGYMKLPELAVSAVPMQSDSRLQ